jgi:hypothetical protein
MNKQLSVYILIHPIKQEILIESANTNQEGLYPSIMCLDSG